MVKVREITWRKRNASRIISSSEYTEMFMGPLFLRSSNVIIGGRMGQREDDIRDYSFSHKSKRERRRGIKYTPINKKEITNSTARKNKKWGD